MIDIEGLREAADDTRTTAITVNWCDMPEESWHGLFLSALAKGGSATRLVSNMLGERMPHRLALALCEEAGVAHQRMADLTKDKREQLIGLLTQYRLPYTGTHNAACVCAVVRVRWTHAKERCLYAGA